MKSLLIPLLALSLAACTGEPPEAPETPEQPEAPVEAEAEVPAKAKEAAELAKALKAADDPQAELDKRGMTREQLDALMFEIASDAELSRAYRDQLAQ